MKYFIQILCIMVKITCQQFEIFMVNMIILPIDVDEFGTSASSFYHHTSFAYLWTRDIVWNSQQFFFNQINSQKKSFSTGIDLASASRSRVVVVLFSSSLIHFTDPQFRSRFPYSKNNMDVIFRKNYTTRKCHSVGYWLPNFEEFE